MRLLLDTHIYLWCRSGDRRLSKSLQTKIAAAAEVYVSHVSLWEIAISASLGRLKFVDDLITGAAASGYSPLEIQAAHIVQYPRNPLHHRDPFDRMLIAQAQSEDLALASVDGQFSAYDVKLLGA